MVYAACCPSVTECLSIEFCWAVEIKQVESKSGIRAWLVQNPSVPVISMSFAFRSGAVSDPTGKERESTICRLNVG